MVATPAEWLLAGVPLFPFYLIGSVPFFFLWPFMVFQESAELTFGGCGSSPWLPSRARGSHCFSSGRECALGVLWIGFPLGFVGSFAVYWAGFLSI